MGVQLKIPSYESQLMGGSVQCGEVEKIER